VSQLFVFQLASVFFVESVVESLLLEFVDPDAPPSLVDAPHVVDIIVFLDNCDVLTSAKIRLYDESRVCFKGKKTATAVEPVLLYVGGEETFPQVILISCAFCNTHACLQRSTPAFFNKSYALCITGATCFANSLRCGYALAYAGFLQITTER